MLPVPPQKKYSWMQSNFCYWVKAISIAVKIKNVKEARFYWRSVRLPWAQLALGINHLALTTISAVALGPEVIAVSLLSSTSLDPIGFPLDVSPNSSALLHLTASSLVQPVIMSALLCLIYLGPPPVSFPRYSVSDNSGCYNGYQRLGGLNSKAFISHCSGGWEVWNQDTSMDEFWWGLQLEHVTFQFSSVQSLSRVQLFATSWITACQASLAITNSRSSLRLMSIESVMPSSHLILCHPLLFLSPIPPSIRVFSNESTLPMRWPKYWSLK